MNLLDWLVSLLPDHCEVRKLKHLWTCPRRGVRGNEQRIPVGRGYIVMCDACADYWHHSIKG